MAKIVRGISMIHMFDEDNFDCGHAVIRSMQVDEKIEESLEQVRNGNLDVRIDRGDLTDYEVEYVINEVRRRYNSGNY